jgi:protein O-mannosyl-transferase
MPFGKSRRPVLLVSVVALLASVTSLGNRFALDDLPIILSNPRVHSLAAPWTYLSQTYWPPERGPALYRPLTILGFALEWAVGGGAPLVFHLASVFLYIVACVAVFWLADCLLPRPAALIAALLFAVHPVHVEAVGNIVGQAEPLVGLLLALAVGLYVRARRRGPLTPRHGVALAALYGLGLMAKEHAAVLPGLLVLAELLVVDDRGTGPRRRGEQLLPTLLAQTAVLVAFWTVRTTVTGGLVGRDWHPAFRSGDTGIRIWTALGVVPEWARLLLFPAHLSADYNPQEIPVGTGLGPRQALGLVVLTVLAGFVAWAWRRRPVAAYGILWACVAIFPVSNLLLPTGIFLAERTLFLASIGGMLAVAAVVAPYLAGWDSLMPGKRRIALALLGAILLAGGVRSALRQPVWKDNPTLFTQTAKDAPLSYRARAAHAVMLLESGQEAEGEQEYLTALRLYRDDPNLFADLGDWYLGKQRFAEALGMYTRVLELVPDHWSATSRSILCLTQLDRLEDARRLALVATRRGDEGAAAKLAFVDSLIARGGPPPAP